MNLQNNRENKNKMNWTSLIGKLLGIDSMNKRLSVKQKKITKPS
jgi:hypothetical protein